MKRRFNYSKVWAYAVLFLTIVTIAPISYAFFTTSVTGNSEASNNVVESGTLRLKLTDGNVIGTTTNWLPGSSITKEFSVENIGSLNTNYTIYLMDVLNEFVDQSDLVYEISGSSNGSNSAYSSVNQVQAPGSDAKIIDNILIAPEEIHSYTITLRFLNKNEEQDDNQNKRFSAKVELYEKGSEPSLAKLISTYITDLKASGATDLSYDGVETLGSTLGTTDNNLRYIGPNTGNNAVKNYVYFNCSTTNPTLMSDENCEKWRIIGVFNNIEKEDHTTQSLVKIIRDESLGKYSWDTSTVNNGYGINQWGESTYENGDPYEGSDLMRELNYDYLGHIQVGIDNKWYSGQSDEKSSMPNSSINSNFQSMIENVKWNLGANGDDSTNLFAANLYNYERSSNNGKICTTGNMCTDKVSRTTDWIGRVALMYPSDYAYATSGGNTSNRQNCLNTSLTSMDYINLDYCEENNWLYLDGTSNIEWMLTPFSWQYYYASFVFYRQNTSIINKNNAYESEIVRPTIFLKSNVKVDSGDGTSSNPYKLIK